MRLTRGLGLLAATAATALVLILSGPIGAQSPPGPPGPPGPQSPAGTPSSAGAQSPVSADLVARGKYVFGAAAGCGCHTEPKKGAPLNAGGRKYEGPFGTVYSTNITPDRQTGIGTWTDDQIVTAIRLGRRPNGERLVPVHPYTIFNGMAEEDLRALVAY